MKVVMSRYSVHFHSSLRNVKVSAVTVFHNMNPVRITRSATAKPMNQSNNVSMSAALVESSVARISKHDFSTAYILVNVKLMAKLLPNHFSNRSMIVNEHRLCGVPVGVVNVLQCLLDVH